jgi:hypothetical protein
MKTLQECINVWYRAAISLNNSAVTLLKREQYNYSIKTFRESIKIMQTILDNMENLNNSDAILSSKFDNDIRYQLQEASHYCAMISPLHGASNTTQSSKKAILKFYTQQDPNTAYDAIIKTNTNDGSTVFTLIMIEDFNQDALTLKFIGLECDTILYNFGVAHSLMAFKLENNLKSNQILIEELRQGAFRLFRIIEPHFLVRLSIHPSDEEDWNVQTLCALFTQAIYNVAYELQCTTLCEYYGASLQAITHSINHQKIFIPTLSRPASAA